MIWCQFSHFSCVAGMFGSRERRDCAIFDILHHSLLVDLRWIVRSYDIRPGQRWSRQSDPSPPMYWQTPLMCNSHTLSKDELTFTSNSHCDGSVQISKDGHFLTTHALNHLRWFCSNKFRDGANKLSILIPNELLDILSVTIGIKSTRSRATIHFKRLYCRLSVWDGTNWIFLNETVFGKVTKIEISILLETRQIKMVANGCTVQHFLMDFGIYDWQLGMSEVIRDLEECKLYVVVSDCHLLNSFTLQIESADE